MRGKILFVTGRNGNFDVYERNLRERMGEDPDGDSSTRRARYLCRRDFGRR